MGRVLAAGVAELRELQTARGRLLVLRGRVVPVLALRALEGNDLAHFALLLLTWPATPAGKQLMSKLPSDTPRRRGYGPCNQFLIFFTEYGAVRPRSRPIYYP